VSDALSNTQLTVESGKTLTLNGTTVTGGTVTDNGTIHVTGPGVVVTANFNGTGAIDIFNNVQFEINGSVVSTDTVFFEGNQGELTLDQAKLFSGLITGTSLGTLLMPNDQIDLRDLPFNSFDPDDMTATVSYNSGVSTITFSDGRGHSITLKFSGDYRNETWQFANDGNGGTLIELANIDHWINSNGGDWNVATNWSEGVPGLTNVALDAPGTYTVTSTTNVDINSMIVDAGVSLLTDPGTLFRVEGNVTNDGTIDAGPFSQNFISTIDIEGNVSGTGLFVISDKAVLEFGGSVSTGETVEFIAGHGELILDDSAQFHGLIESSAQGTPLSTNNLIDLRDLPFRPGHMSGQVVAYNPTTNITSVAFSNGMATITLQFFGKVGNWTLISDGQGGTTVFDPPLSGGTTIASGATLDITSASAQSVTFTNNSGNTGELILDDSRDFTGQIIGFAGNGTTANSDLIDLTDVNFADVAASKTTYTNNGNGTGTLTLYNAAGGVLAQITFVGNYQLSNFVVETDSNGHTLIVDPPAGNQHEDTSGGSGPAPGVVHTDSASNPFTLDVSGSATVKSIQQIAAHDTFANADSGQASTLFGSAPSLPVMDLLHNPPATFHTIQDFAAGSGYVAPTIEPLHLPNGGVGNAFTIVANPDQFVFSESPVRGANNLVADLIQGQNLVSPASSADHWNFAPDTAANGGPQHVELGVDMTQLNHDTFVKSAAIGAQHVSDFHLVI